MENTIARINAVKIIMDKLYLTNHITDSTEAIMSNRKKKYADIRNGMLTVSLCSMIAKENKPQGGIQTEENR